MDSIDSHEALEIGLNELAELLGGTGNIFKINKKEPPTRLKNNLITSKLVSWGKEKYTKGGYACPKVGKAAARKELSKPIGAVLFFAGEATAYNSNPQTVHGALESGYRASHEALTSKHSKV